MGRFLFLQTLHLNIVRNYLFLSKKFDIQEYNKLKKNFQSSLLRHRWLQAKA